MASPYKGYLLFIIVFLVGLLLLANIYGIHRNNQIIEYNQGRRAEAELIKVNTGAIIRSLHLLDLAVRSYVFVKGDHFLVAVDTALENNRMAFYQLEGPLQSQGFPMKEFYKLRDSVTTYIQLTHKMLELINTGKEDAFIAILKADPGYAVWLQHWEFSKKILAFEDAIVQEAQTAYRKALRNTYVLQILLFVLAIPTLSYTAYTTNRTLVISEKLRRSEAEKAALFMDQNQLLERTVYERTREILAQNEEISAQNEEIVSHNEQLVMQQKEIAQHRNSLSAQNEALQKANEIIEEQSLLIQQRNKDLGEEVVKQTDDLKQTNQELVEKNTRLEQFAFIISHNLRAPLARLVGLSGILDFTTDRGEIADIVRHMVRSTQDLDQVVKDLTLILGIRKLNTQVMQKILLTDLLQKVLTTLEEEIKETDAQVFIDLKAADTVMSLYPYVESIFFNLVSNAIKYRHPERVSTITIQSAVEAGFVKIDVADNGLGIDLEKNQDNLFSIYKRFHFHVEGKGLGLFLVKTQVAAVGGKVEVRSDGRSGTVFSIYLLQV